MVIPCLNFVSFEHDVESSLVGTSCKLLTRKLYHGTFVAKDKFLQWIIRLIDHVKD